jgi:anti-sigma-K factor RskA
VSETHESPPRDCCAVNAAPYVLGALPDEEYETFRRHLDACAVCREEVAAMQPVADALAAVAPQLEPPPVLKEQIMSSVREDAARRPGSVRSRARVPFLRGSLGARPALAAAATIVVALIVTVSLLGGSGRGGGARVIDAQVLARGASASLRVSSGHAELSIAGMPQTSPGRVYEVWVERGGVPHPTNALFNVTNAGRATVSVPGSVGGASAVMVTSEPLGGSRTPTRAPVIIAKLS